jgi:hypothetical protein
LAKNPLQIEKALGGGANQGRQTDGRQGRKANKSGGPKRQVGQSIDVLALTVDIFTVVTNKTDYTKQGQLAVPFKECNLIRCLSVGLKPLTL